jgi:hypothetical protein
MKKCIILSILFLALLSCSKDSKKEEPISVYIGKWQLFETFAGNTVEDLGWYPVKDGYVFELFSNRTFTSNRFMDCGTGKYSVSDDNTITFTYDCPSVKDSYIEKVESFSGSELVLVPTYLACDESCGEKFKKIE